MLRREKPQQVENRDILVGSVFSDGGRWLRSYEEAGGEEDGRPRRNLESLVLMSSSQLDQLQLPNQNRVSVATPARVNASKRIIGLGKEVSVGAALRTEFQKLAKTKRCT